MKRLIPLLSVLLVVAMVFSVGCKSDDDDNNPTGTNNQPDPWVGTWLSAGANVAPLLVALFQYDSVRVVMNDDQTVVLSTHPAGGAWADLNGTYTVTKSASGDVHTIEIDYTVFAQAGIIQVISATPDTMKLEVVQTNPDIGATPRTPETGFGSDPTLGNTNIQVYVREN